MTTVWYLALQSPDQLRAKNWPANVAVRFAEAELKTGELNRYFYESVGRAWQWQDADDWPLSRWQTHTERPELRLWILWISGSPAGYVEMERQPDGSVEFISFGLTPPFLGQGLGSALLSEAVKVAFAWTDDNGRIPTRIWLTTCSDDHPNARANYEARGFELFKTEIE
ncbi:GNAT family N-acetyltransferase [Saccharospirillum mangrovi]|uniref:GNAT family N-acetyltransferase n=1 Tax=Saccharospirillum mangrovi TaxID=2161747 RepID=UPI001300A5D2|nr:GNAT family N-acetyltransferase [Saccharospirillum mangrovi]